MTQNAGFMMDANLDVNTTRETVLCLPWIIFASGQGMREEYGTTASEGISAALEQEVSVLCRAFHNALGVQEAPKEPPAVLFWQARLPSGQSSNSSFPWIVTQVLRAPAQPGQRIAYEYFNLVLTPEGLRQLGHNPLRALELISTQELRTHYAAGHREPVCITIPGSDAAPILTSPTPSPSASLFSQNGTWPATPKNLEALLASLDSGELSERSFATWWPGGKLPPDGAFDIVLRSEATRVVRPHEIIALATDLYGDLSRSLPAPPSYDSVGGRYYRALLQNADDVQAMLQEAYFPAALEESPHRWMMRPQKAAGVCQKIADDLLEYASRLPAFSGDKTTDHYAELSGCYADLGHELQKLRHPNMLHQNRGLAMGAEAQSQEAQSQLNGSQGTGRNGMLLALGLGGLLALCLLGFGVRQIIGQSKEAPSASQLQPAGGSSKTAAQVAALSGSDEQRDQQALALMRRRAARQVFGIARVLAAKRARHNIGVKAGISKEMTQSIVVDAIAQAMLQTPHSQIKPAQKRLLYRLATAPIRAKAIEGAKAGIGGRSHIPSTRR